MSNEQDLLVSLRATLSTISLLSKAGKKEELDLYLECVLAELATMPNITLPKPKKIFFWDKPNKYIGIYSVLAHKINTLNPIGEV